MEKFKGKLPKRNGKYLIEIHSEKFIAYYNKLIKKFLWDRNSPIGCSIANAKTTIWYE